MNMNDINTVTTESNVAEAYSDVVVTSDIFISTEDCSFECECGESDCISH